MMRDPTREALELVDRVPRAALPALIAAAAARLALESEPDIKPASPPPVRREPARWLSVEETAERLGWTVRAVYRHARGWDFTRRVGRRLAFDAKGLERWMEAQAP